MKTRIVDAIKAIILTSTIGFAGCKEAIIAGKPCSLNYKEDYNKFLEQLASGEVTEQDAPRECSFPTREPGANLGVNLVMRNFTSEQERKMLDAVERIKIVINSMDFKDRVLAHTYNGKRTFVDNNDMTNEEIYQKIMDGAEILLPKVDEFMEVDVTMYYKRSSTVGYTYPDTTRTWVNSRFFNGYTPGQVAANVTHEWTHKLGFGHDFKSTPSRPYSVPYAIGTIIEDIVDGM